jgi:DNA-binding LytR/AlgR family response regulator
MTYRCLIIEDEPLARQVLAQYVTMIPSLTLVNSCQDALEGLRVLHAEPIDLLFLDIQMPQLSGLQLVQSLARPPKTILTTAFSEFALQGFDIGAVDYLLKPFSFERFLRAVNRAFAPLAVSTVEAAASPPETTYLFFKVDKKAVKVLLEEIVYLQAYGNYIKVFTRDGRMLVATETMSNLETLLPVRQFCRVHKSYIVALAEITEYSAQSLQLGKHLLPIGEIYRKRLIDLLKGGMLNTLFLTHTFFISYLLQSIITDIL